MLTPDEHVAGIPMTHEAVQLSGGGGAVDFLSITESSPSNASIVVRGYDI